MSRLHQAKRLLVQLDGIEKRIEIERARNGGLRGAVAAFIVNLNAAPISEYLASRRTVKALEDERERLLDLTDTAAAGPRDIP